MYIAACFQHLQWQQEQSEVTENCLTGQKLEKTEWKILFLITRGLKFYANTYFFVMHSRDFQAHARKLQILNSPVYQLSTFRFENKIAKIWTE